MLSRRIGFPTATFVVVTSMVGTGIFVTTGDVLTMTQSSSLVLLLWLLGGLIAICGSLSYAELATMMPQSGGEYIYLRDIFGKLPSFLSGWVSLIVGFSASIAISTIALQLYTEKLFISISEIYSVDIQIFENQYTRTLFSSVIVITLGLMHSLGIQLSIRIQNILSIFKISIMALFILFGLLYIDYTQIDRLFTNYSTNLAKADHSLLKDFSQIGLTLLIITFAYSGWNGATYIAEEVKKPERNLPKSLWVGTLITIVFYLLSNIIFLTSMSGEEVMKTKTIGEASAKALFSTHSALTFNIGIILILLSSISVQMMIGPRVYYAMAKDRILFHSLAKVNQKHQTPMVAIFLQMAIVLSYITFNLDLGWLMTYMGFALSIFPFLTVIGLLYLRRKEPNQTRPYRVPFYPIIPLIFLVGSGVTMVSALFTWSYSSLISIAVVLAGVPVFFIWKKFLIRTQS